MRVRLDWILSARCELISASGDIGESSTYFYLGFALNLVAWGLYLGNLASLSLVGAFVALLIRFQIIPEERILESKFGAAFLNYQANTRRWL